MIVRLLAASAVLAALSTTALAADLPVYAPTAPPAFTWTGIYIGGQIGYQWGQESASSYSLPDYTFYASEPTSTSEGVVGGAHLGYNWQYTPFVFGVEGDVDGSSYSGTGLDNTGELQATTRIPIEGSIRARVGFAWDRVLIYGTGGVAFASIQNTFDGLGSPYVVGGSDSQTTGRVGWTAGGGIEYAIVNNWSVRAEYRYTDYGSFYVPLVYTSGDDFTARIHETDNRAEVGFSYNFNLGP
jgi:outer membrane immunogenic protein